MTPIVLVDVGKLERGSIILSDCLGGKFDLFVSGPEKIVYYNTKGKSDLLPNKNKFDMRARRDQIYSRMANEFNDVFVHRPSATAKLINYSTGSYECTAIRSYNRLIKLALWAVYFSLRKGIRKKV